MKTLLLAAVLLTDYQAQIRVYAAYGQVGWTLIKVSGNKSQHVIKCVVFHTPTLDYLKELGCGPTWEQAFADVKKKDPATPLSLK